MQHKQALWKRKRLDSINKRLDLRGEGHFDARVTQFVAEVVGE